MGQMTADGQILDCLACGRSFHKTGYEGVMEWAVHICQPLTITNYLVGPNRFDPFTVSTPVGGRIEYRWASKLPDNSINQGISPQGENHE